MTSNKAHKDDSKGDFDSTSALIRPSWLGEFHLWNMMISIWHDRFRTEFNLEGAGELRALPKALSPVYDKKYKYAYQRFSWEGTVLLFLLDMQFEIAKHLFSSSRNRAKVLSCHFCYQFLFLCDQIKPHRDVYFAFSSDYQFISTLHALFTWRKMGLEEMNLITITSSGFLF